MRRLLFGLTLALGLGAAVVFSQSTTSPGGVFTPTQNYVINALWTFRGASPLSFEGATNDGIKTTLAVADPTANNTLTLPDATDTLAGLTATQTLANKSFAVGTGAATAAVGGTLFSSVTPVSNGTTVETDLITYTLPANTLAVNGRGVRITGYGTFAVNGNTKTVKIYFGATVVNTVVGALSGGGWYVTAIVQRTSATAQVSGGLGVGLNGSAMNTAPATPAETLSGVVTIKLTGQSGTAGGDVTQTGMIVEAI